MRDRGTVYARNADVLVPSRKAPKSSIRTGYSCQKDKGTHAINFLKYVVQRISNGNIKGFFWGENSCVDNIRWKVKGKGSSIVCLRLHYR